MIAEQAVTEQSMPMTSSQKEPDFSAALWVTPGSLAASVTVSFSSLAGMGSWPISLGVRIRNRTAIRPNTSAMTVMMR